MLQLSSCVYILFSIWIPDLRELNFSVTLSSFSDMRSMRNIGLVYFLYLFFFSGLEFTLTFLTYNRFNFDRYVMKSFLFSL